MAGEAHDDHQREHWLLFHANSSAGAPLQPFLSITPHLMAMYEFRHFSKLSCSAVRSGTKFFRRTHPNSSYPRPSRDAGMTVNYSCDDLELVLIPISKSIAPAEDPSQFPMPASPAPADSKTASTPRLTIILPKQKTYAPMVRSIVALR